MGGLNNILASAAQAAQGVDQEQPDASIPAPQSTPPQAPMVKAFHDPVQSGSGFGGKLKEALQRFAYFGGQAAMKSVGLPTDFELEKQKLDQEQEQQRIRISQQNADRLSELNDIVPWRDPKTGNVHMVQRRDLGKLLAGKMAGDFAGDRAQLGSDTDKWIAQLKVDAATARDAEMWKQRWGLERFKENGRNGRAQLMAGAMGRGIEGAADVWTDAIANGEAKLTEAPQALRSFILQKRSSDGSVFLPAKVREQLNAYNPAKTALHTLSDNLDAFLANPNPETWAQYSSTRDGITRLVGRGMGEVGVFTDQDAANFKDLTSVNPALALAMPDMAKNRVKKAQTLIDQVGDSKFKGFLGRYSEGGNKIPSPKSDAGSPPKGAKVRDYTQLGK